jgi:hypothetical protein
MPPSTDALESHLIPQSDRSRDFFWHRLRWRAVRRYVPADREIRLVDVGAGAGLLGEYLNAERPRVEYRFVEPLASLERELERRFGTDANAREEERHRGAQIVTLLDVLEHQEHDTAFLRELAGKMDPGSRLLLTVPAMPSLWSYWDESLGHYKRYTRRSLKAAAAGLPFRTLELSYLFPEMVPPAVLRRRRRASGSGGDDTEFPDLPPRANQLLYGVGTVTQSVRRALPLGTSLLAALERV